MAMKQYVYAGIGARNTPQHVLNSMNKLAIILANNNCHLVSGGAKGADTAFEDGARSVDPNLLTSYTIKSWPLLNKCDLTGNPWDQNSVFWNSRPSEFESRAMYEIYKLCLEARPNFDSYKSYVKKLFIRSAEMIANTTLRKPVDFVVYWTDAPPGVGGTNFTLQIADRFDVPAFNIETQKTELATFLKEKGLLQQ